MSDQHSFQVKDWYVVGTVFTPTPVVKDGKVLRAVRQLIVMDVASTYMMHFSLISTDATTAKASDVIGVLEEAFALHGPPVRGVALSESVWYSSEQIHSDPDIAERGVDLKNFDLHFPAMPDSDRTELQTWAQNRRFHLVFSTALMF